MDLSINNTGTHTPGCPLTDIPAHMNALVHGWIYKDSLFVTVSHMVLQVYRVYLCINKWHLSCLAILMRLVGASGRQDILFKLYLGGAFTIINMVLLQDSIYSNNVHINAANCSNM